MWLGSWLEVANRKGWTSGLVEAEHREVGERTARRAMLQVSTSAVGEKTWTHPIVGYIQNW